MKADRWISWRPRHLNQIADEAANQVMGSGIDFCNWSQPLPAPEILSKCKVCGFSDGGLRRSSGRAAIGWVIVAIVGDGVWQLGKGGALVDSGDGGSFAVEAWALELLADKLTILALNSNGVFDQSWIVCTNRFFP